MRSKESIHTEYEKLEQEYQDVLREKFKLLYELEELKHKYQNEVTEKNEIKKLHENAHKLKHDMRNHLMVIASYLNTEEFCEAKDYTSKILDKLNLDYSYIDTGNDLLNFIINDKLKIAKDKQIYIKAEIENLMFKRIQSIDFSALLGNLLDNAIEGAESSNKRSLNIIIKKIRGYDTIKIENSINDSVLQKNPELNSIKNDKENHGVGLRQVREIVNKYDGMLDIYEENDMFCVYVLI